MKKVLISGGSGLVGKRLSVLLKEQGFDVNILSRTPKNENEFYWNINSKEIDIKAFENVEYVIHLAGAGIADKKWTASRKKELIDSRVESANLLFETIKSNNLPIKKIISASGIGYYGAKTSDKIYKEEDEAGKDFIAHICIQWEKAIENFSQLNIDYCILRTGIVLTKNGGALQKMNTPIALSALGNGKQYMPWIHIDDLCDMYINAIHSSDFKGIYNAVTNNHHTNTSFTKALAKTTNKPVLPLNAPKFALKTLFGELSVILLEGSRVSAEKAIQDDFTFKFTTLEDALNDIYK